MYYRFRCSVIVATCSLCWFCATNFYSWDGNRSCAKGSWVWYRVSQKDVLSAAVIMKDIYYVQILWFSKIAPFSLIIITFYHDVLYIFFYSSLFISNYTNKLIIGTGKFSIYGLIFLPLSNIFSCKRTDDKSFFYLFYGYFFFHLFTVKFYTIASNLLYAMTCTEAKQFILLLFLVFLACFMTNL